MLGWARRSLVIRRHDRPCPQLPASMSHCAPARSNHNHHPQESYPPHHPLFCHPSRHIPPAHPLRHSVPSLSTPCLGLIRTTVIPSPSLCLRRVHRRPPAPPTVHCRRRRSRAPRSGSGALGTTPRGPSAAFARKNHCEASRPTSPHHPTRTKNPQQLFRQSLRRRRIFR